MVYVTNSVSWEADADYILTSVIVWGAGVFTVDKAETRANFLGASDKVSTETSLFSQLNFGGVATAQPKLYQNLSFEIPKGLRLFFTGDTSGTTSIAQVFLDDFKNQLSSLI